MTYFQRIANIPGRQSIFPICLILNIRIEQSLVIFYLFYLVFIEQSTYEAGDFDSGHMHRTHVIIPNEIRFLLVFQLSFFIPKSISKFGPTIDENLIIYIHQNSSQSAVIEFRHI